MAGAAVAGLLASAFVRIAIGKLSSAITRQASMLWNFGKDLEEMKDHLETISAVMVDAERQSVEDELVRLWLKRLKHAAIDISDMLEEYQDSSDQASAQMPRVLSGLPLSYKKISMANRMKRLREELRKIVKEVAVFNFKVSSSTYNVQPYDKRETMSYLPEEPVVGRDGEKQEIINMLSVNTSNDDESVIIAIYGLGGMGKSTLAQLVYNDAQLTKYDYRIWVYVSQDFNLSKIGSSIISQLPTYEGQQNLGTLQAIKQHLNKLLHGKTVLVILDDLWEEDMNELGKLRVMLHVKGSKVDVIVTTRKEEIAMEVSSNKAYKLQRLEDHKCWEIIKRFSKFEHKSNQEKMEQVGLDIAKKCGGVALAARAVGCMLQSTDDLSGWTKINNSDIWNGSSQSPESSQSTDVLPSLKLSYARMPPHLRICFSYCAIFPKGHNIIEDDLVQHWTALEFIEQSKGKECINNLLRMSFLEVSKLPPTSQKHLVRYTMHDLVHDLAKLTVADELQVFNDAPVRNTRANKYCLYSVLTRYDRTMKLANMPSKMRALRFSDCGGLLDIRGGAFSFAKCLRTLDFGECTGILFPDSIGELKQLRCLIAPRMQNESFPGCITELSKLQYLRLNGSTEISALPESIGKLGCLRYLCLSGCSGISELPKSFGDLKSMVHIDMSGCSGIRVLPESFGDLKSLVLLDMSGCSGISELPKSFGDLKSIVHIYMSGCSGIRVLPESFGDLKSLVLLDMSGCSGIFVLPKSFGDLKSIVHIYMSGCSGIRVLPESFGDLKSLVLLDMSGCSGISELPKSFGDLKSIVHIYMSGCSGIRVLPESFGDLKSLVLLDMSGCSGIFVLPKSFGDLKSIVHIYMSGCSGIRVLPESFGDLKSLVLLDMSGCSGISELPGSLGKLTNLQHLALSGCSSLKAIPEQLCGLRQLQYLNLSSCRQIRELPETLMKLQNLLHLDLSYCTMQHLGGMRGLTALQHLDISHSSCSVGFQYYSAVLANLTNLKYLRMKNVANVSSDESASHVLEWIGSLTNLEHLDLAMNGGLACLPASIGNLKRLHTLDLTLCWGLTTLPESIRALELKSLVLHNCSDELVDQASSLVHFSQTLPDFKVRVDDVKGCSNLQLLEGINVCELRISSLKNVRSLEEANKVKLLEKQNLLALSLAWTVDAVRLLEDKDLLGQLVPPPGLKHMCLQGYSSAGLPSWLMGISRHLTNLVSIKLNDLPTCSNLPPLGQLPHLEKLELWTLPAIKRIDREFCGGKGAFGRLSSFTMAYMETLEEWNTTYSVEDGVEFMFPVLYHLKIYDCPRLRFKPCPPTFGECSICGSDQILSLLEEDDQSSPCSSNRAIKLEMDFEHLDEIKKLDSFQSTRIFHYFPNLRELLIWKGLLAESMRHLTSLESLRLEWCSGISGLPEWLGDLSSLRSLVILGCSGIESLPSCIQHLPKLQKLKILWCSVKLTEWCESEENKAKLAHINVEVAKFKEEGGEEVKEVVEEEEET